MGRIVSEGSGMNIVLAAAEDAEELVGLLREAAEWMRRQGIDMWHPDQFGLEQTREKICKRLVYKAELDRTIAGTFELHETDPVIWGERPDDALYVHRLAVKRSWAGRGIGLPLLEWAATEAAARGKQYLRLDCMAENPRLNAYYRQAGFSFCGRKDGKGWSAHLYEKELGGGLR